MRFAGQPAAGAGDDRDLRRIQFVHACPAYSGQLSESDMPRNSGAVGRERFCGEGLLMASRISSRYRRQPPV